MPRRRRLLLLTPAELTRDPRARRAAAAAHARDYEVLGVSGQVSGEPPEPLAGVTVLRVGRRGSTDPLEETGLAEHDEPTFLRELRGLYRLGRLGARTLALWRSGSRLGAVDVVHANDFDTLPAGVLLARGAARLVYDAHELYAEFEREPPRVYRYVASRLEAVLARRADAVVTVSEPIADELERRLRLRRRPVVVLNVPELDPREPEPGADGPLRAVYQGAFGPGRPVGDLLDALQRAPDVRLTLRAVRVDPAALVREAEARGVADRLDLEEPVPPDRVLDGLRGADVGVIFDRPHTRNSELSSPNKLFEYLMAGLAVVAPALPGLASVVEGERVGVTYPPGSTAGLADALQRLAGDRALVAELRARARRAAVERYNAEHVAAVLIAAWEAR